MANKFSLDKSVFLKATCVIKYDEQKTKQGQKQVHVGHEL